MLGRRLLTPFGGLCVFLLIVLLVAGGLGWVTAASLTVEASERDAIARADATGKERLALWQLDSRMFPTLAIENGRPYAQYFSLYIPHPVALDDAGNVNHPGRVPSPLLSADLPDWMLLHFQLDPESGWRSPQVLSEGIATKLQKQLGDQVLLANDTSPRHRLLKELSDKFNVRLTHKLWIEQEIADPSNGIFSVPVYDDPPTNNVVTPPASVAGASARATPVAATDNLAKPLPPGLGGSLPPSAENFARNDPAPAPKVAPLQAAGVQPPPGFDKSSQAFRNRAESDSGYDLNTRMKAVEKATKDGQGGQYPMNPGRGLTPTSPTPSNNADRGPPAPAAPVSQPAIVPPPAPAPAGPTGDGFGRGGRVQAPTEAKKADDSKSSKEQLERQAGAKTEAAKPQAADQPDAARRYGGRQSYPYDAVPQQGVKAKAAVVERAPAVQVGPIHPQWLAAEDGSTYLVLVRAARLETKTVFQGVVLDWDKLKGELLEEIRPTFPTATLQPVYDGETGTERRMAAIPAKLDPGPTPPPPPVGWTPLRWGLSLGWGTALIALAAIWFGGRALIDLSERRIRFVSAVTHELRTPLTSLRLYLDLLTSGMIEDEEKQKEYLRTLHGESDRLNRLIENVLDFARLEKRTVQTHIVPTKVDNLLDQARVTWADRCAADGKELVVIGTVPVDQTVNTDARVAGQILSNLIDNARKYTAGAADPRIWVWAKPGDGRRIILEVEDRGPGVPLAERATIFRPFRRGSSADTTAGGAGLGLALAKQWAEMIGGRLSYRVADGGGGACFRLELPIA
ncbi:sensor histidine kinase [Limnoglobus roseus]|uniref:histidine kinase n=1 Tax=Limnoglobus roseus TaxID=2598579 RepID=A0A5C1A6G7_9BACT|nr:HAMP domain-containing sensor histidine kinase [Limnoglobus roseus]QEL13975.1 sensor histidine kinase [Limnoglobus roseus]